MKFADDKYETIASGKRVYKERNIDNVVWDIVIGDRQMHNRIILTAKVSPNYCYVHLVHGFFTLDDKGNKEMYRSMTGQIFTIKITYHKRVTVGEYTWAIRNDRLANDMIFYPKENESSLKPAQKWMRRTAYRLMRKFWEEHDIPEDPQRMKELKQYIDTAFDLAMKQEDN